MVPSGGEPEEFNRPSIGIKFSGTGTATLWKRAHARFEKRACAQKTTQMACYQLFISNASMPAFAKAGIRSAGR